MSITRTEGTPHDRLTRLCSAMTEALEAHPECSADVKCIVMLQDAEKGGLQLHGYENDTDAMVDLFIHMRAIFRASGKDLALTTIGHG